MRRVIIGIIAVCVAALVFSTMAFAQARGRGGAPMMRANQGLARQMPGPQFHNQFRQPMAPRPQNFGHHRPQQNFHHGNNHYGYHRPNHWNNHRPNPWPNHYGHHRPPQWHNQYGYHRPPQQFPHWNGQHPGQHQANGPHGQPNHHGRRHLAASPNHPDGWQTPPGWNQGNKQGWQGNNMPPGWVNANGPRSGWQGHHGNGGGRHGNSSEPSHPVEPGANQEGGNGSI